MSSFSADWLSLREPADVRSRSRRLAVALAGAIAPGRPIRILDLAAGTGSNARYLADVFRSPQDWLLVDHDEALLDVARRKTLASVTTRVVDLSDLGGHHELFAGRDLVTASALLDLVSERWLRDLVSECASVGAAVLFALSYDGRIECVPEDPEDGRVRGLVNRHQRGDKGFGVALGPEAAAKTAAILGELGYDVSREPSDWRLTPESHELQSQLIEGWAQAATEVAPLDADAIGGWRTRRLAHLRSRRSHLLVGHEDIAGRLRSSRGVHDESGNGQG